MRFPSMYEAESFINVLKVMVAYHTIVITIHKKYTQLFNDCTLQEILKDDKDPEPLNTDFGSEISSQSVFMSSNKHSHRYEGFLCD